MAARKTAAAKAAAEKAEEPKGTVTDLGITVGAENDNNAHNMGGGGDVAIPADDGRRPLTDKPVGVDGINPVSPNNPPAKAVMR
jgi:hypothetical protein